MVTGIRSTYHNQFQTQKNKTGSLILSYYLNDRFILKTNHLPVYINQTFISAQYMGFSFKI